MVSWKCGDFALAPRPRSPSTLHSSQAVTERGTCLKRTTSWAHRVQHGASTANGEGLKPAPVVLETQLWHACQKSPSGHLILSASQGSLGKGKFSLPASYWGQLRRAALGEIGRRRQCMFSAFSPDFLLPLFSCLLPQSPQKPPSTPTLARSFLSLHWLDPWRRSWFPEPPFLIAPCLGSHSLFFIKTDISVLQGRKLIG